MRYNPDGAFYQFMTGAASFIGLNVLFLITCLPVFTIGTALASLYTVTMQEARGDTSYIFSDYLKAFKKNFFQSTAAFLLHLVLSLILLYNIVFWGAQHTITGNILLVLMALLGMILILSFLYTYPLIARFSNTLRQTLKNSVLLALMNMRQTLILIVLQATFLGFCLAVSQAKIFMLLIGFAILAYFNSRIMVKVFTPYESSEA